MKEEWRSIVGYEGFIWAAETDQDECCATSGEANMDQALP